jgi:hypothetical protein
MDMGVEELVSAAGSLHRPDNEPTYAHRCPSCGRLISVLANA